MSLDLALNVACYTGAGAFLVLVAIDVVQGVRRSIAKRGGQS